MSDGYQWCLEESPRTQSAMMVTDIYRHFEMDAVVWRGREGRVMRIIVVVNDVFNAAMPNLGRVKLDEVIRREDLTLQKMNYEIGLLMCAPSMGAEVTARARGNMLRWDKIGGMEYIFLHAFVPFSVAEGWCVGGMETLWSMRIGMEKTCDRVTRFLDRASGQGVEKGAPLV